MTKLLRACFAILLGSVSAQNLSFTPLGSIPGPAELVKVKGAYAYISAGPVFTVVDISKPEAPMRMGSYTFPERIWGFRLSGDLAYVAADLFGLGILDVSNPSKPALRGSFKTPGQAKNVTVSGSMAIVADHVSGLDMLNVSNPAKPVSMGSVFLEGFGRDAAISGSHAYAADMPSGFYVVDLLKKDLTEPSTALQSASVGQRAQVEVLQDRGLVVLASGGPLQMYDVSNAASAIKVPAYRTPGPALRMSIEGSLVYVAEGREGFQILDLSNPSNPRVAGAYKTSAPAADIAVSDSLVLVVLASGETQILKQTP